MTAERSFDVDCEVRVRTPNAERRTPTDWKAVM